MKTDLRYWVRLNLIRTIIEAVIVFWIAGSVVTIQAQNLRFNEIAFEEPSLIDEDGDGNFGWIELKNIEDSVFHLKDIWIALNDTIEWALPEEYISPNGFLFIWLSGKDRYIPVNHASFTVSNIANNNFKLINHSDSSVLDSLVIRSKLDWYESYSRFDDGWFHVTTRTPLDENLNMGLWKRVSFTAPFKPRDSAPTACTFFNNKYWVFYGWTGDSANPSKEIWSSPDLVQWELVSQAGPYATDAFFVVFNGKIWAFDGNAYTSTDGLVWDKVAENLPFQATNRIALFKDSLWVVHHKELFKSSDGINWVLVTDQAPWDPRELPGFQVFRDKLWFFGGAPYHQSVTIPYKDVWASIDGENWELVTDSAVWPGRAWFVSAVFDNKLWKLGGWDSSIQDDVSDVWYTEDGLEWKELKSTVTWQPRHAPYIWVAKGSMWVSSGYYTLHDGLNNDIWKLDSLEKYSANDFYLKQNGIVTQTSSWSHREDGLGFPPIDFHRDKQRFHIINNDTVMIKNNWIVDGLESSVIVGDSSNAIYVLVDSNVSGDLSLSRNSFIELRQEVTPNIVQAHKSSYIKVQLEGSVNFKAKEVGVLDIMADTIQLLNSIEVKNKIHSRGAIFKDSGNKFIYDPNTILEYSGHSMTSSPTEFTILNSPSILISNCDSILSITDAVLIDTLKITSGRIALSGKINLAAKSIHVSDSSNSYIITLDSSRFSLIDIDEYAYFPIGTLISYNPIEVNQFKGSMSVAVGIVDSLANKQHQLNVVWIIESDSFQIPDITVNWEMQNQAEYFDDVASIVRLDSTLNWETVVQEDTIHGMKARRALESNSVFTVNDYLSPYVKLNQIVRHNSIEFFFGEKISVDSIKLSSSLSFEINFDTAYIQITESEIEPVNLGETILVVYNSGNELYMPLIDTIHVRILKKILQVVVENYSKIYGDENPLFKINFSGFLADDSIQNLDELPTVSTDATNFSCPGDFEIKIDGGYDDKYDFVFQSGLLTIHKKDLIISTEHYSKIYGEENLLFKINFSGFINNDTIQNLDELPTVSTDATNFSYPGDYEIKIGGGYDDKYNFVFVPGILTILKKGLSVKPLDVERHFNEPNPIIDFEFQGFINGENPLSIDELPEMITEADRMSPPGIYELKLMGGYDDHYELKLVNGKISILPPLNQIFIFPNPARSSPSTEPHSA